jgi:hypothetical protein
MALRPTPRRAWAGLGMMMLAGMAVGVLAPAARATPPTCRVFNETHPGLPFIDGGHALTAAIAAAMPGDLLAVIGTCTGTYTLDKNLTLTGISLNKFPVPTLDGNQLGTTLVVRNVAVTLSNLTITGGAAMDTAPDGGGIFNNFGTVRLDNSTVSGNTAVGTTADGGGIFNNFGTARLDNSTVSGNAAGESGGGIFNNSGTVTLVESIVSGNIPDDCFSVVGC